MKRMVVSIFVSLSCLASVHAQDRLVSPGQGTPERKAILDGVRPVVEQKLKGEVVFVVNDIRAYRNWAFVMADPQRKDGKKFDIVKLFGKEASQHMDGLKLTAVLQKKGADWVLVEHMIGATDVWWSSYCDDKARKVPKEVLGVCPG